MRKNIAHGFTLLNLLFGCLALLNLFEVDYYYSDELSNSTWVIIPEKMYMVSLYILLAAVVDFIDGYVARKLDVCSELGKQLDSLADLVSFGVVPGFIVYKFLNQALSNLIIKDPYSYLTRIVQAFQSNDQTNFAPFGFLLPAFLIPLAAAYRLARFNISETNSKNFQGIPTPVVGLLMASYPILFWQPKIFWSAQSINIFKMLNNSAIFWYLHCFGLSYLMVCQKEMLSLKGVKNDAFKKKLWIVFLAILIPTIILFHWLSVLIGFIYYLIISWVYRKNLNKMNVI